MTSRSTCEKRGDVGDETGLVVRLAKSQQNAHICLGLGAFAPIVASKYERGEQIWCTVGAGDREHGACIEHSVFPFGGYSSLSYDTVTVGDQKFPNIVTVEL